MPANALIQTRIDPDVKERASHVLHDLGLTVSDAVRILLTRIANDGGLPPGLTASPADYDAWFRAKVREALEDSRPVLDGGAVEAQFADRRTAARRKAEIKS